MKAKQKRNWLQYGGTALGAGAGLFLGNPMLGAKLGGMGGSALASTVKDDVVENNTPSFFPEQSPAASYGIPGMPQEGQHSYQGGSLLSPRTPQSNPQSLADKLMTNTATGGSVPAHRNLVQGAFGSQPEGLNKDFMGGMSLFGGNAEGITSEGLVTNTQNTQTTPEVEAGPIDDAIRATEMTNKLGLGSDIAKMLVNMGGLMNPMKTSDPFTADKIKAPEYKDAGEQMRGDLNQSLGVSNALLKDLSPEQRVAGVTESMQGYQQGQRDISRHEAEVGNMNAAARAEADNQNTALDLELQQANYQKNMIENQAEHMRKQVGVSEIMKSVDSIINRGGQSGMNTAGLRLLKDMWPDLDDEARAEFMSIFGNIE